MTIDNRYAASVVLGSPSTSSLFFSPTPEIDLEVSLAPFFRGTDGIAGSAEKILAAVVLGGHRVVTITGFYAEPSDSNIIAGVTKAAAISGSFVEITSKGLMTEPSWNWTPNAAIFVGPNGTLTQSPPTSGFIRRIAWAISSTSINIDLSQPIFQI